MKRRQGIRCYGFEMERGNAVVCTQIASPHASGNGWVHVLDRPCDCGEDHTATYRGDFIPRASKPATPAKVTQAHKSQTPDAIHDYGAARLLRYGSGKEKRLCWQHFDRDHGWIDGLGGVTPGFYRAEAVRNADARKPVYLAGGEKCVDALAAAGAVAGCNPGGEGPGKWREEYGAILSGRHVVILADADERGRTHAQLVADSLAGFAASVRVIELEGAHDVADWLADGHTYGDLLEITACTLPVQYSTHAPQDDPTPRSQKTESCPNCQRWQDRAKIAETTVANMRRDKWREDRLLAIDNEKLSAPEKVAALAIGRELSEMASKEGVERNEQGMPRLYRGSIAHRTGVKEKAAGVHMQRVAKAGLFQRDTDPRFQDTAVFMAPTPLYENLDPEAVPTPERANGWGGKRVKACPHCLSPDIVATNYSCRNCGSALKSDELISIKVRDLSHAPQDDPIPDEGDAPEEAAQHDSPPLEKIVGHLASDGDALRCPECGRGGDMLKDYGDGPRCRACDALAERRVS